MKTRLIFMMLFFSIGKISFTQNIPNPDFENLDVNGFPQDWSGDGFGSGASTQSHTGTRSMSVWNWYYYGKGFALNGIASSHLWAYKGGTPYTQKATRLTGFYRYDTVDTYSNHDSAMIAVLLKKYNTTTQQVDTIGYGKIHLPAHASTDGTFAPFSVDIADWDATQQPDSIVVLLLSSLNGFCENADDGNCLYFNVDNLSLETPLGITDIKGNEIKAEIYPNPASENTTLKINAVNNQAGYLLISDISGKAVFENKLNLINGTQSLTLPIEKLDKGIYVVTLQIEKNLTSLKLVKE